MSHFPNMMKSNSGFTSYLVQVGMHDKIIVYRLGPDGAPQDMAAGDAREVFGEPLARLNPGLRVVNLGPRRGPGDNRPVQPWEWGLRESRWQDVVKKLNGKSITTGELRGRLSALSNCGYDTPQIENPESSNSYRYVLTELGKTVDAALDEDEKKCT